MILPFHRNITLFYRSRYWFSREDFRRTCRHKSLKAFLIPCKQNFFSQFLFSKFSPYRFYSNYKQAIPKSILQGLKPLLLFIYQFKKKLHSNRSIIFGATDKQIHLGLETYSTARFSRKLKIKIKSFIFQIHYFYYIY